MKRQSHSRPFAKKSLGQNFLTDPNFIRKIVDAVKPSARDTIIEIGPGRGALTERLVDSGANVIAIELDRELVPLLRETFRGRANFSICERDALESDFGQVLECIVQPPATAGGSDRAKLVANLPYYISTAILQRLIGQRHLFTGMVLMFQREVVERITAKPGNSDRGFLTVLAEASFDIERLFDVPPSAFHPVPKVWSTVARLVPKRLSAADEPEFRTTISAAFTHKRQTLLNNLKTIYPDSHPVLNDLGIAINRRAESLSLEEWTNLYKALAGK